MMLLSVPERLLDADAELIFISLNSWDLLIHSPHLKYEKTQAQIR
jgi:hypothetical protein